MLDKLINEGIELKKHTITSSDVPSYVERELFEKWRTKCIVYLKDFSNEIIVENFNEATKNNFESNLNRALGILNGLKEYQETK